MGRRIVHSLMWGVSHWYKFTFCVSMVFVDWMKFKWTWRRKWLVVAFCGRHRLLTACSGSHSALCCFKIIFTLTKYLWKIWKIGHIVIQILFNNNILLEEFSLFLVHRFKITFGQLSQDGVLNSGTVEIPVMKEY